MSRKFDRTTLPPLRDVLKPSPSSDDNNLRRAIREIRQVALALRSEQNLPFYSMRELATCIGVPLRTIAIAFEHLESEGLLLRLRGSHTKLLGHSSQPLKKLAGVVGMPVWIFGLRHFIYRRTLARALGDALWNHSISIDTILYWEYEDLDHTFIERLLHHHIDAAVWFQPFRHNLEAIGHLKDRGVRSLVISDQEIPNLSAHVVIDWQPAYEQVLAFWKKNHGIRKAILVEGPPHTAPRLRLFEELASRHGIACSRHKSSPELPGQLARGKPLAGGTAIALFDDHASTEFSMRDPEAFLQLADRHRILFAREIPSIPFAAPGRFPCERLCYPVQEIVKAASEIVLSWRAGEADPRPQKLLGLASLDFRTGQWM